MTDYRVLAIDPERLQAMRTSGRDDLGNSYTTFPAEGWEPLRCCLRKPQPGERIALISYRVFEQPSPWAEVGPVFVHGSACAGYTDQDRLPETWRHGPRLLRTYRADESLDYDHIVMVPEGDDIEKELVAALEQPGVGLVHVRSALPQCFHFAVRPR